MGVNPKIGGNASQIIHFNKVSIINHPFWGFPPIFGNTHFVKNTEVFFFGGGNFITATFEHSQLEAKGRAYQLGYRARWMWGTAAIGISLPMLTLQLK